MSVDFSAHDEPLDDGSHLVAVRGEVDIFTAPEFKERINAAIDSGAETVLIDLMGATFLDSSSLGVLISAHRRLGLRDGKLVIACDVKPVLNTFKVTGLDSVLPIAPDREDALALAAAQ